MLAERLQHDSIEVALSDGEVSALAPNPGAFRDAKLGIYRLRSTGEEVVDPDLTTVWTIRDRLREQRRAGLSPRLSPSK
jgi:hypothetical protein